MSGRTKRNRPALGPAAPNPIAPSPATALAQAAIPVTAPTATGFTTLMKNRTMEKTILSKHQRHQPERRENRKTRETNMGMAQKLSEQPDESRVKASGEASIDCDALYTTS
jgi:hypothetical protein